MVVVPLSSSGGLEKATSRARPTTTEGTASGSMNSPSNSRWRRRPVVRAARAAQPPTVSAAIPATRAVVRLVVRASSDWPRPRSR